MRCGAAAAVGADRLRAEVAVAAPPRNRLVFPSPPDRRELRTSFSDLMTRSNSRAVVMQMQETFPRGRRVAVGVVIAEDLSTS